MLQPYQRRARDQRIRDAMAAGQPVEEVAARFQLSARQVWNIVGPGLRPLNGRPGATTQKVMRLWRLWRRLGGTFIPH